MNKIFLEDFLKDKYLRDDPENKIGYNSMEKNIWLHV